MLAHVLLWPRPCGQASEWRPVFVRAAPVLDGEDDMAYSWSLSDVWHYAIQRDLPSTRHERRLPSAAA
jgi:hypothetical protein